MLERPGGMQQLIKRALGFRNWAVEPRKGVDHEGVYSHPPVPHSSPAMKVHDDEPTITAGLLERHCSSQARDSIPAIGESVAPQINDEGPAQLAPSEIGF